MLTHLQSFSPFNCEESPALPLGRRRSNCRERWNSITAIPTAKNPKILGVTFGSLLFFTAHTTATASNIENSNKILKSLAGSTWSKDKEMFLATFKVIGRSVLSNDALVWSPGIIDSRWTKFQTYQKTAIKIATGALRFPDYSKKFPGSWSRSTVKWSASGFCYGINAWITTTDIC